MQTAHIVWLDAHGRKTTQVIQHDAPMATPQNRDKRVYDCPTELMQQYLPYMAGDVLNRYRAMSPGSPGLDAGVPNIVVFGRVGLELVLDDRDEFRIGVETAALWQLLCNLPSDVVSPPALVEARRRWDDGMCAYAFSTETGWRGTISESRLWLALSVEFGRETKHTKYTVPQIRAWYHPEVLRDILESVGPKVLLQILKKMESLKFQGCPDLVLYNKDHIRFVEVKSATDKLTHEQSTMLKSLAEIAHVTSYICAPRENRQGFIRDTCRTLQEISARAAVPPAAPRAHVEDAGTHIDEFETRLSGTKRTAEALHEYAWTAGQEPWITLSGVQDPAELQSTLLAWVHALEANIAEPRHPLIIAKQQITLDIGNKTIDKKFHETLRASSKYIGTLFGTYRQFVKLHADLKACNLLSGKHLLVCDHDNTEETNFETKYTMNAMKPRQHAYPNQHTLDREGFGHCKMYIL